jgi:hypothetical protein
METDCLLQALQLLLGVHCRDTDLGLTTNKKGARIGRTIIAFLPGIWDNKKEFIGGVDIENDEGGAVEEIRVNVI